MGVLNRVPIPTNTNPYKMATLLLILIVYIALGMIFNVSLNFLFDVDSRVTKKVINDEGEEERIYESGMRKEIILVIFWPILIAKLIKNR